MLNLGFVVVEALYGWKAGSLALLADAGHNLSDVAGLILAWGAALRPGAPAVAELLGLAEAVAGASIVITGEGSFDAQSATGHHIVGAEGGIACRACPRPQRGG